MTMTYPQIESRTELSPLEFHSDFVGKKPVVIRGLIKDWPALHRWNEEYFMSLAGDKQVKVKVGTINERKEKLIPLKSYIQNLIPGNSNSSQKKKEQEYLHDIPLPTLLDPLRHDMNPFPEEFLGKWYRYKWWRNLFFFYGAAGNLTPMHFDNLGTHNLFFHVRGRKRFIIVPPTQHKYCYMHKYSWSQVDPENPDYEKFPLFRNAEPKETLLEPGDVLYLPPFTLHNVRSIDLCMSMNVDWHTKSSCFLWLTKLHKRMRFSRIYYNFVYMLGIVFGIPARQLYPIYKFYLRNG